jgi:hypothetical protein
MGVTRNEHPYDDLSLLNSPLRSQHTLSSLPRALCAAVRDTPGLRDKEGDQPPMNGQVSRLVNTHGSSWGKIRLSLAPREVFFNLQSMVDEEAFWGLEVGQAVEFDEEIDRTNGTRAVQVQIIVPSTLNGAR